jgi:hypothetical protein
MAGLMMAQAGHWGSENSSIRTEAFGLPIDLGSFAELFAQKEEESFHICRLMAVYFS